MVVNDSKWESLQVCPVVTLAVKFDIKSPALTLENIRVIQIFYTWCLSRNVIRKVDCTVYFL